MTKNNMPVQGQGFDQPKASQNDISDIDFAALVPVIPGCIGGRETGTASAKALHEALNVGRVFSSWFNARVKQYGFIEGIDYIEFDAPDPVYQSSDINQLTPERVLNQKRGRPEKDYRLSLDMAKELGMVERNERGRAIRQYFISCEVRLRQIAPEEHQKLVEDWKKKRVAACNEHKSMGDAVKGYIERTGDKQHGFAYSNECTFLNSLILGMHPRTWSKQNGIPAKKARDHMNAGQLALLAYLESRNCTLLDLDTPTPERKAKLTELAQRWKEKREEVSTDERA